MLAVRCDSQTHFPNKFIIAPGLHLHDLSITCVNYSSIHCYAVIQFFESMLANILSGLSFPVHEQVRFSCNSAFGAHSQEYVPS